MSQFKQNATLFTDLEIQCPNCRSVCTHSLEAYNIYYSECETCGKNLLIYRYLTSQYMVFAERISIKNGIKGISTISPSHY